MKQAFFKGKFVPFSEAKISIMTHAFNYGTACFEGIRGYYNNNKKQLYILKLTEHYERLIQSCKIVRINLKYSLEEMCKTTLELAKRNDYQEDVYIRPLAYKSEEKIGLGLSGVEDDFCIYLSPFGKYLDTTKGIKVAVSTWRRIDDSSIPARAKLTGSYINSSLAKSEAKENGFDEAIMLSMDGHVSEGSGENLFLVRGRKLITPYLADNILEGITRNSVIELAKNELGLEVEERSVDRTELYVADEIFLCGTGAEIAPVLEVDRRSVKEGKIGSITKKLQELYFSAVRGETSKYSSWLTPVK
ncbi:MAG: branched-chain amino acid aminotransferase [Candidatus Saganbacteria bacterium]|uniref:Branched-chain-amino-acid aminotransferase n=1 Tax=Candidatus Saganbacteria bacterium TaxID=2575572 RepID=A0A833L122_UNCSA|nr:MAG: branched-chain amino acid aminotransferase [Candidatus Saganbacteria bacterium]